jgi:hypothetical protein
MALKLFISSQFVPFPLAQARTPAYPEYASGLVAMRD